MGEDLDHKTDGTHSLTDWELWACARQQISQHADAAPVVAALRADELLEAGDMPGCKAWRDILARINQLQSTEPGETKH